VPAQRFHGDRILADFRYPIRHFHGANILQELLQLSGPRKRVAPQDAIQRRALLFKSYGLYGSLYS
jgi:hypothetical protein